MSLPAYRSADPVRTYYAYNGAWAFLSALTFTLSMVYYVRDAGLNPLQMVLVGTVLERTFTAVGSRSSSASL